MQATKPFPVISRALIVLGIVLAIALIAGAWVTRAGSTAESKAFCSTVEPVYGDEAVGAEGIKSGNGQTACGVFKVCGWGTMEVKLSDYPDCAGKDLTVLCMNDDGAWVDGTVDGVGTTADGLTVNFGSEQDGHCGLFPAGSTPSDLKGPVISGN